VATVVFVVTGLGSGVRVVLGLRHVALFALLMALAVGCSGGGDEDVPRAATATASSSSAVEDVTTTTAAPTTTVDAEPPPLTHAQFVPRLDRLCKRGNRALDRFNRRYAAAIGRGDYDGAADIWQASTS
jgi:hypothetical protein